MRDACAVLTHTREVAEYANDRDVTFTSSVSLAYMSSIVGISSRWLLDDDATFHLTSCRVSGLAVSLVRDLLVCTWLMDQPMTLQVLEMYVCRCSVVHLTRYGMCVMFQSQ